MLVPLRVIAPFKWPKRFSVMLAGVHALDVSGQDHIIMRDPRQPYDFGLASLKRAMQMANLG
jgi:hypothetical protein